MTTLVLTLSDGKPSRLLEFKQHVDSIKGFHCRFEADRYIDENINDNQMRSALESYLDHKEDYSLTYLISMLEN